MALNVSIQSDGRIGPKAGAWCLIPPQNAGVGDLVFKNSSGSVRIYGRGTANATTYDGYTFWGCIYGFVSGMAMIVAPDGAQAGSLTWGSYPSGAPYWSPGTVLMRNGKKTSYYAQMNTSTNQSYITSSGVSQPSDGLLTSAYHATPLTASSFAGSANAETKKRFGSWLEYIRQTLRVNGAPGTPFGAPIGPSGGTAPSGVKVHEFGRWMGMNYFSSTSYPAGNHCYKYKGSLGVDAEGTWWLPSMFELGELMIDEHLNKVNENSSVLSVGAGLSRWSCVLYSTSGAWIYNDYGMSSNPGLSDSYSYLVARPVTLLKLV